jgi:hypothetical protein
MAGGHTTHHCPKANDPGPNCDRVGDFCKTHDEICPKCKEKKLKTQDCITCTMQKQRQEQRNAKKAQEAANQQAKREAKESMKDFKVEKPKKKPAWGK